MTRRRHDHGRDRQQLDPLRGAAGAVLGRVGRLLRRRRPSQYGYPDEMVYILWAFTMLIPAYFAMRGKKLDRRPIAAVYGLLVGLTGAGGQLRAVQGAHHRPGLPDLPDRLDLAGDHRADGAGAPAGAASAGSPWSASSLRSPRSCCSASRGDTTERRTGPWLLLALIVICVAWGVQAFFMRKAAVVGVNDATTFGWMTISGLLLVPVAFVHDGRLPDRRPVAGARARPPAPSCSTRSARCSW